MMVRAIAWVSVLAAAVAAGNGCDGSTTIDVGGGGAGGGGGGGAAGATGGGSSGGGGASPGGGGTSAGGSGGSGGYAGPACGEEHSATTEEAGVRYCLQTDSDSYDLTGSVGILYELTNTTAAAVNLGSVNCADSCKYKLTIGNNGGTVWESCHEPPPCGTEDLIVGPGESWAHAQDWSMDNDNGTSNPSDDFPVDAGNYVIEAKVYTYAGDPVPVSLSIELQ